MGAVAMQIAVADAQDVAKWIVWFANEHGEIMTNLRLQKLMYYAQAWHLALHDKPLMDVDFQAWIHGPVISHVYGEYKKFGSGPIVLANPDESETMPEPPLAEKVKEHLRDVLESYGDLSAWSLEKLTHSERPWVEARGSLPIDAPCKNAISRETMRSFYKEALNEQERSQAQKK
jgi:uncharacterized phage-associated protein